MFDTSLQFLYTHSNRAVVDGERQARTEVRTMISVKINRIIIGVLLAGSLTATTACVLRPWTGRAPAVKPTVVAPSPVELVPVSAPSASAPKVQPQELPRSPDVPEAPVRPSSEADDPRAVIDWLLNRNK